MAEASSDLEFPELVELEYLVRDVGLAANKGEVSDELLKKVTRMVASLQFVMIEPTYVGTDYRKMVVFLDLVLKAGKNGPKLKSLALKHISIIQDTPFSTADEAMTAYCHTEELLQKNLAGFPDILKEIMDVKAVEEAVMRKNASTVCGGNNTSTYGQFLDSLQNGVSQKHILFAAVHCALVAQLERYRYNPPKCPESSWNLIQESLSIWIRRAEKSYYQMIITYLVSLHLEIHSTLTNDKFVSASKKRKIMEHFEHHRFGSAFKHLFSHIFRSSVKSVAMVAKKLGDFSKLDTFESYLDRLTFLCQAMPIQEKFAIVNTEAGINTLRHTEAFAELGMLQTKPRVTFSQPRSCLGAGIIRWIQEWGGPFVHGLF